MSGFYLDSGFGSEDGVNEVIKAVELRFIERRNDNRSFILEKVISMTKVY